MVRDKSLSSIILDIVVHIVMLTVLFATLYPVLHVLASSLSSKSANDRGAVTIFPVEFTLSSYQLILRGGLVLPSFRNSAVYTIIGTALNLIFTGTMAYSLSRKKTALRGFYTFIVMIPMYFSGGMIPSFLLVRNIGLYNSMWALILPGLVSVTNFIIMRTFFQGLPPELEESASLDGANDFYIFFKIMLPLSKAVIYTIGLYYAVSHWNSWFSAMIYLNDTHKYPLQLILRQIVIQSQSLQEVASMADSSLVSDVALINVTGIKFATLFVSIIPMLAIYPFVQKHFIKGIMIGSLKG